MARWRFVTTGEEDTLAFAGVLAEQLTEGDTVLLRGDLGAGKSVFARGIARGLGVTGAIPSPTFTLMIPYRGKRRLYHFDLYRLSDPDEFEAAGLDEYIGGDGVAVVEWPEMAALEPQRALTVRIARGAQEQLREITIENNGVAGFAPERLSAWRREL